jgi:hypothetical protein
MRTSSANRLLVSTGRFPSTINSIAETPTFSKTETPSTTILAVRLVVLPVVRYLRLVSSIPKMLVAFFPGWHFRIGAVVVGRTMLRQFPYDQF